MLSRRTLPRTGVPLTELTFGSAGIGNLYRASTDAEARATVDAAWDAGVRVFDTAPHYGLGLAERRLGEALADRPREEYVLSTKVGRLLVPDPEGAGRRDLPVFDVPADVRRVWDFSRDGVLRSLEESLQRLGTDSVDVVYVHDPDEHGEQAAAEAVPALVELREQGVVRAIGVGMNQSAMLTRFVRETDVDLVMCAGRYTLLEQPALDDLLPAASERDVAVVAAAVFNSGLLARDEPPADATYGYAPAPQAVLDRARELARVCRGHGTTLPAAALQLPLAHPGVVSVAVGVRSPEELRADVDLLAAPVPDELWDDLRARGLLRADVPTPRAA